MPDVVLPIPPPVNDEFVKVRHDREVQALPVLSLIKLEPSCFCT
jgi:hypothetical protein